MLLFQGTLFQGRPICLACNVFAYGSGAETIAEYDRLVVLLKETGMTEDQIRNALRVGAEGLPAPIVRGRSEEELNRVVNFLKERSGMSEGEVRNALRGGQLSRVVDFLDGRGITEDQIENAVKSITGDQIRNVVEEGEAKMAASIVVSEDRPGVRVRVETLHRAASENAACLNGCRILGRHVIGTASSPEKLGKFIARAMIQEAISLHKSVLDSIDATSFQRMGNSLDEYRRQFSRTGHFDIDRFIGTVEELRRLYGH